MNDEWKAPEYPPEHAPETTGMRWLSIADVEGLIGKRERNARYWLERHDIPSCGERPKLFSEQAIILKLAELGQPHRKPPEIPPEHVPEYPPEGTGIHAEPIEAAYRVTPAEIEQAVSRTSAQYMGDLRTMLAEVGKVYEGQLAAKDAALEAKDQALAIQTAALGAKDETIAELRRRAEAVETERAALLQRAEDAEREARAEDAGILLRLRALQEENVEIRRQAVLAELVARSAPVTPGPPAPAPHHDGPAQAAQEAPGTPETPIVLEEATPGVWGRLRRWWRA